jgi:adenosylmethionine-8-amino-7-oxononanoate aminotransferase
MGRTGSIHAWERESIAPDIQIVAKGLGGGYAPISALLMSQPVVGALQTGTAKFFNHGHTYQNLPVACAAALEVQRIIQEDGLLENVERIRVALCHGLKRALDHHKHIGNIRGRGALWAIEFVQDKESKEPFPPERGIARGVRQRGLTERYGISLQPYSGTMNGVKGDHIMISPAYNVTMEEVAIIIEQTTAVIVDFFKDALQWDGSE